ncbi:DMT family transporter [Pseudomonas sp. RIT-PI-AD]|uniref:DMT family transporter n=1 Tax=Pseudomonas sp. RIT-PI-AD TaxID=3035294 RepID=UPI0021D82EBE|nr:DMT family transporter [Pseudomonas sp. RIT-PI-AD]
MGLLAAMCWGITDFLAGFNARAVGVRKAVFFGQALGFLIVSLILTVFPSIVRGAMAAPWSSWGSALLAALFTVSGTLALSRAFSVGQAAIVAPVVTAYGAVTALLSWLSGERLGTLQWPGLGACLLGVALTAVTFGERPPKSHAPRQALGFAVLAALLYGCGFWLQGRYALPALGVVPVLWLGYAVGLSSLTGALLRRPGQFSRPPLKHLGSLLGASLMNLSAFSAFSVGALQGSVAVVTVLSTLSGGIAAILGVLLFKERLNPVQWGGVGTVILGALILHLH